ncbi:5-(carboxyamino)imidazole ribonucleotide synthase [Agilicoccus flavus]|uniref:5-(carboxyamino)imidazole ribonucleotide synthase n=1 Tax=Agilicoccus flavus TaxID=2775968 RepID=UPI001CF70577|nr:5-(carboxyamino)imidazole ribonucleotide synthase [Agilicoccus flavus]
MSTPRRAPGGFPVVGIIGGGQLARMCAPPAVGLAVTLDVLAESPDASAALVVPAAPVGACDDLEAVRAFARDCDVVTFDHEHVPGPVLAALEADGVPLHPSPAALRFAQDKLAMRERMEAIGVANPRWARVRTRADLEAFGAQAGWPLVLKTPRGGYDGKGVRVVDAPEQAADWLEAARAGQAPFEDGILAEERVGFVRELAVLVARSPSGQASAWPVVETVQVGGICTEVLAPAPGLSDELAGTLVEAGLRIAGELGVTGVMAVEMFEVPDADAPGGTSYVVNELAMRPHNSGHWSIDGAVTSQFEQHLRAVLDLPLGSTTPRARWTVMGNVLGGEYPELYGTYKHLLARDPGLKMHLYGKGVRPGRKIGHVNVCGDDLGDLRARAAHACDYLRGTVTE